MGNGEVLFPSIWTGDCPFVKQTLPLWMANKQINPWEKCPRTPLKHHNNINSSAQAHRLHIEKAGCRLRSL